MFRAYQTPCTCVEGLELTGQLLGTSPGASNEWGNGSNDPDNKVDFT